MPGVPRGVDGSKHPISESLIDNPNRRCMIVPVVAGFPEVKWQIGADWFSNLDESQRGDILGPSRFDACEEGKFSFADLAALSTGQTWGRTLRTATKTALTGQRHPVVLFSLKFGIGYSYARYGQSN